MQPKGLHHVAVSVPNRAGLAKWFVETMDMKIMSEDKYHTFVDAGNEQFITLFDADKTQLHHITISVDNVNKVAEELTKKGIKFHGGALHLFEGPDGIPLQISPTR